MKRQIRRGTFETNSSSVHSLTMCTEDEFKKWENGEVLYDKENEKFVTKDEIMKENPDEVDWNNEDEVKDYFKEWDIQTFDEFFDDDWYETYKQKYITPNGEKVIAFGYYGHD